MHDLIRRYARDLAAADPGRRRQALERLLDYYQHTAARAEARLARQTRPGPRAGHRCARRIAVPDLADGEQALAWARAERGNLLACLDHVTRAGQHARVVALTAAMAALLRQDGPWAEAVTRHATAAQAARRLGDRHRRGQRPHRPRGVRRLTGDYPGAAEALEQALGIYRDLGDRLGEANALSDLGVVWRLTGDYPGAAEALEEALGIYRDLGDRLGEANALALPGGCAAADRGLPGCSQSAGGGPGHLPRPRRPAGEANTLNDLGVAAAADRGLSRRGTGAGGGLGHLP